LQVRVKLTTNFTKGFFRDQEYSMIHASAIAPPNQILDPETIQETLRAGLTGKFKGQRILILIPDHTRNLPLPQLFKWLEKILFDTLQLDFMVALGTHPALNDNDLNNLLGISTQERSTTYKHIQVFNHSWETIGALVQIGKLTKTQIQGFAGDRWHPSLGGDVPIKINRKILDYDHILILGPTTPHEVVGFSGGVKYLFPGISGPEMINTIHWLGALSGVINTIGVKDTPVRRIIHAAFEYLPRQVTLVSAVVLEDALVGIFIGDYSTAWEAAVELSSERHILLYETPFQRVLSWMPERYDELWTAAKGMYKLETVVADGGEIVIYAPHLEVVSRTHGKYIYEIGYHVLEYFLKNWDRYKHISLGVLAHSTNLRGAGSFDGRVEIPRIEITLASKIPPGDCQRLNLGYLDPEAIDIREWGQQEDEGILFVPEAGEMLYRLKR
jgi:nickel-dependent lactate racemase